MPVKYKPNKIVIKSPFVVSEKLPCIRLWCDHVKLTPLDNKIAVFNKQISKGLKLKIPTGGQTLPSLSVTDRLLWKNLQKNEKKNITSEVIKKSIPNCILVITLNKWRPWNLLSRTTSCHHLYIIIKVLNNPINKLEISLIKNHFTKPLANKKTLNDPNKGHGLFSNKW